ncbi:hypothetical protein Pelo_15690 [Pelomyxa schiedti]|nr:hypothetical protein Pelo_15690 [Pelomyxa schiedti]
MVKSITALLYAPHPLLVVCCLTTAVPQFVGHVTRPSQHRAHSHSAVTGQVRPHHGVDLEDCAGVCEPLSPPPQCECSVRQPDVIHIVTHPHMCRSLPQDSDTSGLKSLPHINHVREQVPRIIRKHSSGQSRPFRGNDSTHPEPAAPAHQEEPRPPDLPESTTESEEESEESCGVEITRITPPTALTRATHPCRVLVHGPQHREMQESIHSVLEVVASFGRELRELREEVAECRQARMQSTTSSNTRRQANSRVQQDFPSMAEIRINSRHTGISNKTKSQLLNGKKKRESDKRGSKEGKGHLDSKDANIRVWLNKVHILIRRFFNDQVMAAIIPALLGEVAQIPTGNVQSVRELLQLLVEECDINTKTNAKAELSHFQMRPNTSVNDFTLIETFKRLIPPDWVNEIECCCAATVDSIPFSKYAEIANKWYVQDPDKFMTRE